MFCRTDLVICGQGVTKSYAHERMINTSYGQEWVSQTAIVLDKTTDRQFPSTVISAEDKMKE